MATVALTGNLGITTAVAFGPARNGYRLFLPYFNREFADTSSSAVTSSKREIQ